MALPSIELPIDFRYLLRKLTAKFIIRPVIVNQMANQSPNSLGALVGSQSLE
jgi:hypothetical protein